MIFYIEIPVLWLFLEIRSFEIHGFSFPPINRELGGFPVLISLINRLQSYQLSNTANSAKMGVVAKLIG